MRILLDTNVVLDLSLDPRLLRPEVVEQLSAESTSLVLSVVSPWEISLKWGLGKLALPEHPRDWVKKLVREIGAEVLPVSLVHTTSVADLPGHLRDPFDRLLVAQAQVEGVPIVTADRSIARYDVEVIAAR